MTDFENKHGLRVGTVMRRVHNVLSQFLLEPNDQQTRAAVRRDVRDSLDKLVALYLIHGFFVVCDETNNTPDTIDRGELLVDVYVKRDMFDHWQPIHVRVSV